MPIQFDENGNPLPPKWPPEDYVTDYANKSGNIDETNGEMGPPEFIGPPQATPQQKLFSLAGINTTGPKADEAAQNAQDYRSGINASEDVTGQGAPQQYGVQEPGGQAQGPLSPQEAAERMPTDANAMEKLIKQHTLPSLPQASRDGYQNYVTAQHEKRDAERQQQQQRAMANRSMMDDQNARVMGQLDATNRMQGAGGLQGGGYGGGGGQGGPRVERIGGYAFVHGSWRPQDSKEAAQTNMINAQADYARARPDIAASGIEARKAIASGHDQTSASNAGLRATTSTTNTNTRVEGQAKQGDANRALQKSIAEQKLEESQRWHETRQKQMDQALALHQQALDTHDANTARQYGDQIQSGFDQTIAELMARQGQAKKDVGRFFGPSADELQDRPFDPKTNKPSNAIPNSYKALASHAVEYAGMLQDLAQNGKYTPRVSPEARKLVEELSKSYVPPNQ